MDVASRTIIGIRPVVGIAGELFSTVSRSNRINIVKGNQLFWLSFAGDRLAKAHKSRDNLFVFCLPERTHDRRDS